MKFKNLFSFGKLTALGFTQEDAQGHKTSGSISVCHPQLNKRRESKTHLNPAADETVECPSASRSPSGTIPFC